MVSASCRYFYTPYKILYGVYSEYTGVTCNTPYMLRIFYLSSSVGRPAKGRSAALLAATPSLAAYGRGSEEEVGDEPPCVSLLVCV